MQRLPCGQVLRAGVPAGALEGRAQGRVQGPGSDGEAVAVGYGAIAPSLWIVVWVYFLSQSHWNTFMYDEDDLPSRHSAIPPSRRPRSCCELEIGPGGGHEDPAGGGHEDPAGGGHEDPACPTQRQLVAVW